jgi:hypothetical protein
MPQLTPFNGVLGRRLAAHLLRRTTYQVTPDRIKSFSQKNADEAVEELLQEASLRYPDGPIFWGNGNPVFELARAGSDSGEVLDTAPNFTGQLLAPIALWRIYECIHCSTAQWRIIHWLASLFNLKVDGGSPYYFHYHYWRLMHHISFGGSLKDLAVKVTTDNNMLYYLNNNQNRANRINENYAREFLELFTILKGPVIGVGNYTNYTEADITTAAQVLTGWEISYETTDPDTGIVTAKPNFNRHDETDKTFSSAFQDTTITAAVDEQDMYRELTDFVNMVFNQPETARAYVRKMYRFFVKDIIDPEVETDIIQPLADDLFNGDYQPIPVLKRLLKSAHFYDMDDFKADDEIIGSKIKSPFELFCTTINMLNLENNLDGDLEYLFKDGRRAIADEHFTAVGMDIKGPETVEGFPGYYDETAGFSRAWFTTNIVFQRYSYGTSFKRGRVRNTFRELPYQVDIVAWTVNNIDDGGDIGTPSSPMGAADAYRLVNDVLSFFLPELPQGTRYNYFLQALLGGLSPTNWYFSWKEYIDTGEVDNIKVGLERLYDAVLASPEFQTF